MKAFAQMTPEELKHEKAAFAKRLGARIRETRHKAGLTQERLADLANYHPTYIGNLENATHLPSSHTLWRLAKAMDIDLADLLKGL